MDGAERLEAEAFGAQFFFCGSIQRTLFRFKFDVGELPEMGVNDMGGSLADEEMSVSFNDESGKIPVSGSRAGCGPGELMDFIFLKCGAVRCERAEIAAGRFGGAKQCA